MNLSIIIVHYKTPALLLDCLDSVFKFDTTGTEIIVVDNDSQDKTEELLKNKFPAVIFLQMGYNSGFARANNAGIKISKGKQILLLNSDTINLDDAVNKCSNMLSASAFSAAGVQLLNHDRSPQISGNYAMKGGLNYLLPLPYTGNFLKGIANLFNMKKPSIQEASDTVEVDWINGAFLMVKKEAIEKAGLLDEDFFLYAEEAEWCNRIKKFGRLCIFGSLNVLHLQGESANNAFGSEGRGYFNLFDKKGQQIILSNFLRIRKQFGAGWFLFDAFIYFLEIPVFFVGVFFASIFSSKNKKYSFTQARSFCSNMFKLLKFFPRILANKPFFYKVL